MPLPPIARTVRVSAIASALKRAPIVALLGARQCGKTTLARGLAPAAIFDLEEPAVEDAHRVAHQLQRGEAHPQPHSDLARL